jgi:hypothetical protein
MKNRGGMMECFIRLPTCFVRWLKRTMSPEAGFFGFVETGPAAAAYSDPHFDDLDQQAFQKGFVEGVLHPIKQPGRQWGNFSCPSGVIRLSCTYLYRII